MVSPRHHAGKIDIERWNANYEALIRYGQQFGHCNVPQATTFPLASGEPCKLGNWINKQRKDKKNECLLPDRERKLQILVDSGLLKWNMNGSAAEANLKAAATSSASSSSSSSSSARIDKASQDTDLVHFLHRYIYFFNISEICWLCYRSSRLWKQGGMAKYPSSRLSGSGRGKGLG